MDNYDILYLYLFGDGIASYLVLNYDILSDFLKLFWRLPVQLYSYMTHL